MAQAAISSTSAVLNEVVGVDIDPDMLKIARAKNPGVELLTADMRDFDLGRRFRTVLYLGGRP